MHTATIADFAPGHSVVQSLLQSGLSRVLVTDWRSASPEMRFFSIDSYLADLNVAIDEIGAPVDLVGLCQGGWMALVYAARFPHKVRRLVLVGAPVDIRAAASSLSRVVVDLPTSTFDTLVRFGEGRILGKYVLKLWGPSLLANETDRVMQEAPDTGDGRVAQLEHRFDRWYACVVNLPGTYYLQVVHELFKENKIAEGRFVALGRRIDLKTLRAPIFLLAGRDDELDSSRAIIRHRAPRRHAETLRRDRPRAVQPSQPVSRSANADRRLAAHRAMAAGRSRRRAGVARDIARDIRMTRLRS